MTSIYLMSWCEQRDLEKIAYEEMLADSK
jgi:hypothetical protein